MTINDITSHKYNAWQYYDHLPLTTDIVEASREPLTLKEVRVLPQPMTNGMVLTYDVALTHACIDSLIKRFHRRETLLPNERLELAQMAVAEFSHWSVLDLKCFEHYLIANRIATVGAGGQQETALLNMDESSILSKMRAYDKMRPGQQMAYYTQSRGAPERPLTEWHREHLLGGLPYNFAVPYEDWIKGSNVPRGDPTVNCERYWRSYPDLVHDQFAIEAVEKIIAKVRNAVRSV